ncbi:LOW QUALITY PROTEIN: uncharacterized protein LOC110225638 [Arabidopsis lyrata subsp. lyrata]|uniref:LOW QUALITY PROTEIN: uncharacterized protein LOC110225638 n=1 Tax=Arabidopsis lyrata subsp. lyrata TaxID=81972 RepID=UPI000A29C397|nr:LOW QUALITY PROTEIN: uncharacterized protein LOC110225638 [Arabidopsis lyrata subsp. lyrata]|eukprot:XP_020871095.1 LOW QUALITY PROTEIN: uncharacterized protein LOC110225638 [Arabidopsis lyrata subsp. lyrata]
MKNYGKGPRSPLIESRFRSQQLLYQQIQDDARREPSSGYDVSHSQELSDGFEDRREIGNNFHRTIPQIASDKVCDDFNAERVELSRWNVAHKEDTKWNVYNEPNGTMQQMVKELMCSSTGVEYEISRCSANDLITWINNWETYLCESKTPQTQWLPIVYSHLEGAATGHWIKSLWKKNSPTSWKEFKCMLGQETKITREVARELWGQDMDGVDVKRSRALHIHMGLSTNSRGNNLHHNVTDSVMMERNGIIRNGSMFWTNSAKAWEQVSSDAHELRVGAESIRVLCIGFREIAPQNTIEAVPYVLPAREVQETQSLGATRGREISQAHSQEFNGVKKGIIGPVIEGTLKRARQSRYLGIFQERTVSEYWTRFEKLCLNSMTLPGQHLEEIFLQGLKPELQAAVRHLQPNGIDGYQSTHAKLMSLTMVQGITNDSGDKLAGVKKEYEYRNELEGFKEDLNILRRGKEKSVTDLTKNKCMRFNGFISGHKVVVFIDSGATNNFMSERLTTQLKLSVMDSSIIKVSLSYGLSSNVKGRCQEIALQVKDIQIVESYYLLELGSMEADVILGYEWLSKLGETEVNWQDHTFSFIHNHKWVTFCGKNEDLKQGTTKVKMRNENEQAEQKDAGGMVDEHYLEDKVALKGVSKEMWGGSATEIQWKQNVSGETQEITRIMLVNLNKLIIFTYDVSHSPRLPDMSCGNKMVSENPKATRDMKKKAWITLCCKLPSKDSFSHFALLEKESKVWQHDHYVQWTMKKDELNSSGISSKMQNNVTKGGEFPEWFVCKPTSPLEEQYALEIQAEEKGEKQFELTLEESDASSNGKKKVVGAGSTKAKVSLVLPWL